MVVSRSLRCCWKAKRNAVAARLLLSSKRELRFREQQVLAVPLCGARYGWRDIEGRTENKVATSALHTPRKLAIAYYIIHEWRSFRRADRRPTRFFAIRRDCEKQKRQRKPGGGGEGGGGGGRRAFRTNLLPTRRNGCDDERRCRNPFPRANFANEFC